MCRKLICLIGILCVFLTAQAQEKWFMSEKDSKFGYVNSAGETKIPYQYPFVFTDTMTTIAFVAVDHKIKAIDRDNNPLFTVFVYDSGPDYEQEGVFRIVDDTTQKMGFANIDGQIVIRPAYDFVTQFSEGLAAFNEGGRSVRDIDGDGHSVMVGGKWGFIDHEGKTIFPAIFDQAWSFDHGKVKVEIGGRDFIISLPE